MVSARRIVAILIKDLRDAGRDGRILLLLLMPIGLAVFYTGTLPDAHQLPTAQVAVVDAGGRGVARELRAAAGNSVKVEVQDTRDRLSARKLVAAKDVEVAVVVAPNKRREPARAEVLVSEGASPVAQSVVALVPDALTRAAGRTPGAQTQVRVVAASDRKPGEMLESRELTVLLMIVLLLVFVAMMVVPIQMAEEIETGTLGALRLAAPGPEILAAKALAGFLYGLAGVALIVLLTQLHVHDPLLFFAAAFALIASLVGFGLMMGPALAELRRDQHVRGIPHPATDRPGSRRAVRRSRRLRDDPRPPAIPPSDQAARRRPLPPHPIPRRPRLMGSDRRLGAARLPHPRANRITPGNLTRSSQPNLMDTSNRVRRAHSSRRGPVLGFVSPGALQKESLMLIRVSFGYAV